MKLRGLMVVVPCPYQGHINPMLQLASILQSNGFPVAVIHTKYNSPNPANHPNLNFLSIPDGLSDHDLSSGDYTALVLALNANCAAPLESCLAQMLKQQQTKDENQLACIIYDELMYFSESVAKRLKLPSIIFRTNNAATFLARGRVIQLIIDGRLPFPDSELQEQVAGHYPLRFKDLPTNSKFGSSDNFLKALRNLRDIRSSSAMIWNTIDCLEKSPLTQLKQESHVPIFTIGPLFKFVSTSTTSTSLLKEDTSCISWLDKQNPDSVIYVSLGSLASMNSKAFAEMAWGLANSKQPFLWVVRPGSVIGSEWIESLPEGYKETIGERGCIVRWAPQKQILKHGAVGLFWTHCGWNSTLESICEGVPMICTPNFGDQKVTARYASNVWKVGVCLENELQRGEIEKTIKLMMMENEGRKMKQRAVDLKNKVEDSIKELGSSYNSLKELVDFIMSLN